MEIEDKMLMLALIWNRAERPVHVSAFYETKSFNQYMFQHSYSILLQFHNLCIIGMYMKAETYSVLVKTISS